jgi:Flp pilus assembly pilin Flp
MRLLEQLNSALTWFYGKIMDSLLNSLWANQEGQDIAEYSVMLAVILVIVVGTVRLIGSNANNVFSLVGSGIQ